MRERPSRHAVLMHMASAMAERSTCERAQVGVVIARDGRVLSTGYNGAASGLPHCDHTRDAVITIHDTAERRKYPVPTDPGCRIAVHAEANAVAYAARYGVALGDSTLYTTYTPCLPCAQIVINAGIIRVVALKAYRDNSGWNLLKDANLSCLLFEDVQ